MRPAPRGFVTRCRDHLPRPSSGSSRSLKAALVDVADDEQLGAVRGPPSSSSPERDTLGAGSSLSPRFRVMDVLTTRGAIGDPSTPF